MLDKSKCAFLELLRAGLWEQDARLLTNEGTDYNEVLQLAQDQAVTGLVAAGLERVSDKSIPKVIALQFAGQSLQLEQRNLLMNRFIGVLVEKMNKAGVTSVLVKGQGVAQCYQKPQWRASGDVDFLFDKEHYQKSVDLLFPLSSGSKPEGRYSKHLGLSIHEWYVELHGTLRSGLSSRIDKVIDEVQDDTFAHNHFRTWKNGVTDVHLPSPDNDVFFIFTHFIKHFYKEGLVLKQLCDLCRLLWTYRDSLDIQLLNSRVRKAGLMAEWKGFAAVAVDYLGMPAEAMPMYDPHYRKKGERILGFLIKGYSGNKIHDTWNIAKVYPWQAIIYLPSIMLNVNSLKIKERLFER